MMEASLVAERARACVGVRFRPQGRNLETGLDCIGLAAVAAAIPDEQVPRGYVQRSGRRQRVEQALLDLGFAPFAPAEAQAGDILVCAAGAGQLHLAVRTPSGFVHADVLLRRVVERALPVSWPVLSAWRVREEG